MRDYLRNAPWWVWSLVVGSFFSAWTALFALVRDGELADAAVRGVVSGILFGAVAGPLTRRQISQQRAALGPLSAGDERAAWGAVFRGRPPEDAQVRAAAARGALHVLDGWRRRRKFSITVVAILLVVAVLSAPTSSPWSWVVVACFSLLLVGQLWIPRHLARRVALLSGQPPVRPKVP